MKWVVITISLLFAVINLSAQQTVTTGNLLRINFTKPEIDYSDTLWQWKNVSVPGGGTSQSFLRDFKVGNTTYIVYREFEARPEVELLSIYVFNNSKKNSQAIYGGFNFLDPNEYLFYMKPMVEYANNGAWLFCGMIRSALFIKNDSLFQGKTGTDLNIIHNVGKIENKNLLVLQEPKSRYGLSLYLSNLTKSPEVTLESKVEVWKDGIQNFILPFKIHYLSDSLYLFKKDYSNVLYCASFTKNRFNILKQLKPEWSTTSNYDSKRPFYIGKTFYYLENNVLYKEAFNVNTLSLENKTTVKDFSGLTYTYDTDSNYIAYYRNDTLNVYSIEKEKDVFTAEFKRKTEWTPWNLCAPYLYLQQTKTKTGIEQRDDLPVEYSLKQNYPNPFNPETTISYSIPVETRHASSLQYVTLKVYDVLGRDVATLVNEYKQPGTYKEKFSVKTPYMASLQSGVYFYQLRVGDPSAGSGQGFVQTMKMLLIK
ncbi:MAG: Carbohydrate binding module (family 6) [Stygiobacter sp.]|nr:MAG: Carbohydrate binding module (family 6) [Stygiobacter sp.]KAF0217161.1 MAG: Carbohydrate binding module [Ignavibacteria bacterium]